MRVIKRINIYGCPFDCISFHETALIIKEAIVENKFMTIVTGNVDFVMKAANGHVFRDELWKADLVVPDGVPILWAASLLGSPLKGRVNGTDLVWKCAEISAEKKCAVALIGGRPGVSQRAAHKLQSCHPGSQFFAIPTPFPLSTKDNLRIVDAVRATNAKIVLVALGAPAQERWIQTYLAKCHANIGIGIGSAFDIIAGDAIRAPKWMQNLGLEWLHRLRLEPRRLAKRYLIEDSLFFWYLVCSLIQQISKNNKIN